MGVHSVLVTTSATTTGHAGYYIQIFGSYSLSFVGPVVGTGTGAAAVAEGGRVSSVGAGLGGRVQGGLVPPDSLGDGGLARGHQLRNRPGTFLLLALAHLEQQFGGAAGSLLEGRPDAVAHVFGQFLRHLPRTRGVGFQRGGEVGSRLLPPPGGVVLGGEQRRVDFTTFPPCLVLTTRLNQLADGVMMSGVVVVVVIVLEDLGRPERVRAAPVVQQDQGVAGHAVKVVVLVGQRVHGQLPRARLGDPREPLPAGSPVVQGVVAVLVPTGAQGRDALPLAGHGEGGRPRGVLVHPFLILPDRVALVLLHGEGHPGAADLVGVMTPLVFPRPVLVLRLRASRRPFSQR